jgi:hypothetical protein
MTDPAIWRTSTAVGHLMSTPQRIAITATLPSATSDVTRNIVWRFSRGHRHQVVQVRPLGTAVEVSIHTTVNDNQDAVGPERFQTTDDLARYLLATKRRLLAEGWILCVDRTQP